MTQQFYLRCIRSRNENLHALDDICKNVFKSSLNSDVTKSVVAYSHTVMANSNASGGSELCTTSWMNFTKIMGPKKSHKRLGTVKVCFQTDQKQVVQRDGCRR